MLTSEESVAQIFRVLSVPARLRVLMAIAQEGEACVCHLEAMLGMRQALISQHLMALRQAGLVTARREGRFVYYRLKYPQVARWVNEAAEMLGVPWPTVPPPPLTCRCLPCRARLEQAKGGHHEHQDLRVRVP